MRIPADWPAPGSGAILINEYSSFTQASASCALLGEILWSRGDNEFFALNNSLGYQIYLNSFPHSQLFWIANATAKTCQATTYKGIISNVDCKLSFPALCSQSAPVSNFTATNTSTTFQITQQVGTQQLTGYRDFYVFKFIGVRYAPKPDRFAYSTLFAGTGQNAAISYPPACQQYIGQVPSGSSEDCLSLNIWTPYLSPPSPSEAQRQKLKPVMFWIYGGGFTSGEASNPNTDGTNLASRGDVVVVAINYRVGFFGFLAYPDGIHNGNYGIGDMVTALQWVRENIVAFGGDKDRVTIFGESAGAAAVRALLASSKAKGLFVNAIMQSTPDGWAAAAPIAHYMSIADYSHAITSNALASTNCSTATDPITCLKGVDATVLANLQTEAQYPVVDGTYLTTAELALNNTSQDNTNINVITGGNRDEVGIMIPYPYAGLTIAQWFGILASFDFTQYPVLTNAAGQSLFSVPADQSSLTQDQIANITWHVGSDGLFNCALVAAAHSASQHEVFKSIYAYQFNRTYGPIGYTNAWCSAPITASRPLGDPEQEYYKCHGAEQWYTFGNLRLRTQDRDGLDVPFSQLIVDYWASFAWSGNPNPQKDYLEARGYWTTLEQTKSAGSWDTVVPGESAWRVLQWDGFTLKDFPEQEQCGFLGLPIDYFETHQSG